MKILFEVSGGRSASQPEVLPALPSPIPSAGEVRKLSESPKGSASRYFAGAMQHKYAQFQITLEAAHKALQYNLTALRAHSRDLCQNNPYARRYVTLVATHVVGPEGITFESEITGNGNKPKQDWNDTVEAAWKEWGRAVTTDGLSTWVQFQQLVARTTAADGECLIHKVRGYPNLCGFALELIDADRLDWTWNAPVDGLGNRTIMGIQLDRWGRRTGYWIWSAHPMDYEGAPRRVLVPASEIIHVYDEDRAKSIRGIPWNTGVMVPLSMLGRLLNSQLEAANWDSDRVMLVKGPPPSLDEDGLPVESPADPVSVANSLQNELRNDHLTILGMDNGTEAQFPPNNAPNPHLPDFAKILLKSVATGLNVAYHALSADVADANYTASRVAMLDERDRWQTLQRWFIARVCDPVFLAWLEMAIASGAIKIPVLDWKKLYAPRWWPRSWETVDPLKEINASILAVRSGLSTYRLELGGQGRNWRKVMRERAEEEAFQVELGLHLELDNGKASSNAPSDPAIPEESDAPDATPSPAKGEPKGAKS